MTEKFKSASEMRKISDASAIENTKRMCDKIKTDIEEKALKGFTSTNVVLSFITEDASELNFNVNAIIDELRENDYIVSKTSPVCLEIHW